MSKIQSFFALTLAAFLFGSFGIYVRFLSEELLPYQQIGFRNIIALIISVVMVLVTKQTFTTIKKVPLRVTILYALSFPLVVVFYTLAVLNTKIVTAIFGLYLGSLVGSLCLGMLLFQERLTRLKLLSLSLVGLGLLSYTYPFDLSSLGMGFIFALICGALDSVANAFKKHMSGKIDRFVLVVLQMLGGIVIAGVFMAGTGQLFFPILSFASWLIAVMFGISIVAISYLTLIGFQNFDLNLGTVVLATEIFFASIFALIFFQETASFNELLGGILIVLATVVANMSIKEEGRFQRAFRLVKEKIGIKVS